MTAEIFSFTKIADLEDPKDLDLKLRVVTGDLTTQFLRKITGQPPIEPSFEVAIYTQADAPNDIKRELDYLELFNRTGHPIAVLSQDDVEVGDLNGLKVHPKEKQRILAEARQMLAYANQNKQQYLLAAGLG